MTRELNWNCETHADTFDCADAVVGFTAKFQEYGLIIHDGGTAMLMIRYCPWCGERLPESQRDRWYDELEHRGIDPSTDDIPAEYQDARWLRSMPQGFGAADAPDR